MSFESILYPASDCGDENAAADPSYFSDLHLDQIVNGILESRDQYRLEPFFFSLLTTTEAVHYRQAIMRTLDEDVWFKTVGSFAAGMCLMRDRLDTAQRRHGAQQQRWVLHAAETYCETIEAFCTQLERLQSPARGLQELSAYVRNYVAGSKFRALAAEASSVAAELAQVQYTILITESGFRVGPFEGQVDANAELVATFDRFREDDAKSHLVKLTARAQTDSVEEKILTFVAELFPVPFARLEEFARRFAAFADPTVLRFDREVQFYVAYIDFMRRLKAQGLPFAYAEVGHDVDRVLVRGLYDASLALRLSTKDHEIVRNDIALKPGEHVIVVSGPNQGGKTTFLRAIGQVQHLAAIGCPVPAEAARLPLCDSVFTHFEREEMSGAMHGQLEDDMIRIHEILAEVTPQSVLLINEMFGSTSVHDALGLATLIMKRVLESDCLCVWVTFLYELGTMSPKIVSLVSGVAADDPNLRTFKVERRPADGRAYAMSVARKYGLAYDDIRRRTGAGSTP